MSNFIKNVKIWWSAHDTNIYLIIIAIAWIVIMAFLVALSNGSNGFHDGPNIIGY